MKARIVACVVFSLLMCEPVFGQKGGGRSSSSSHSSSSSSRSFGGSRSSSSRPSSSGFSRPSSSTSSRSSYSSKPPSTNPSRSPMFSGGSSKPSTPPISPKPSTPMFGGSKPSSSSNDKNSTTSSKPVSSSPSTKSQAQSKVESRNQYLTSTKATAPPKKEAVVNGKTVKVETNTQHAQTLRSKPSTYVEPTVRRERIVTHVNHYHYSHPYDYYYSRPVSYGIGPYSGAFWWMMSEWSAERRAAWLYHNQARISAEAYADAARDAEVMRRLQALESQRAPRNPNYVDAEFVSDPTDMYDQGYVEAVYNPVRPTPSWTWAGVGRFVLWCGAFGGVIALVVWLMFFKSFGK